MVPKTDVDPEDSLPLADVGEWALEKHARLHKYVDISRAVRRKFTGPGRAGATLIDLYCGPGRARIRETGALIDGSPLVAFEAARAVPFTEIHLADFDSSLCDAALKRLEARGSAAQAYVGPAIDTVEKIAGVLNPRGLHFAFLDPFNLEALPFDVIRTLSRFERMDMLIHVSAMDLQRNLLEFISGRNDALDTFAPGWREAVDVRQRQEVIRRTILEYWMRLIRSLDMQPSQGVELVTGGKNQNLYWLVFVARHPRADEFWQKIRDIRPQGRLL